MESFDLLAELPEPASTTVLEASAGTGKTYALAGLVARYIVEGRATLDEMLLITFTRAATRELRERVRGKLVEAAAAFDAPDAVTDPLLRFLVDVDETERAARVNRLRDALAGFDDASVLTTHGFCQIVLKSLGVAGDSDAGVTLVDSLKDLVAEITDDLYLAEFTNSPETPALSREEAGRLAVAVAQNPDTELRPDAPPSGSMAAVRRDFGAKVLAELEIRKRRRGVLSYDDLLTRLAAALADPDAPARERMRRRWRVVLVDEFQDTDPVQWQVLRRAFHGHATVILIGDPKQAIYAFRGADIDTYLQACRSASRRQTLDTNWRSDADLVGALRELLGGAALGKPDIVVHDVQAHQPGSRLGGPGRNSPVRLRVAGREQLGLRADETLSIDRLRGHIASDLSADIARRLTDGTQFDGKPLCAGDIAVIVERNPDAVRCQQALLRAGIPAVYTGETDVFKTDAAEDWLTLLDAFDQPHRPRVVRAAGATLFFGHTANTLAAGGAELTDRIADTLREWGAQARERGVAAVLAAAQLAGVSERVLGCAGGERRMTDLAQLTQLLGDAAHRDGLSLPGLAEWLRRQRDENNGTGERRRRLDSDAQAVQVMTVWASKGLQFPVVYLPYSFNRYVGEDDYPRYHESARRCLYIGGPGAQQREAQAAAAAEAAGETLRVNYVGFTRAQSQVVAWWAPSKNEPTGGLSRLLRGREPGAAVVPDELAPMESDSDAPARFRQWHDAGVLALEDAEILAAPEVPRSVPDAELAVRRFTRSLDAGWRRTSYSGLLRAAEGMTPASGVASEPSDAGKDDEADSVDGDGVYVDGDGVYGGAAAREPSAAAGIVSPMAELPAGAAMGSLVHAVLETADPTAPDLVAELAEHARAQLMWWPSTVTAEELAAALAPMHDTPLGPLADGLTLRDIGLRDRLCELDFEIPLAGGDRIAASTPNLTVDQIGGLLRAHLSADDPMAGYAERLMTPELGAQPLRGYLSGSIDAVLRVRGDRYLIVDYKTNKLGEPTRPLTSADYGPRQLADAMIHSHYPLQALLYSVVLHRFLRWRQPGYQPEKHLGGVLYLFLRGMCGPDTPTVDGVAAGVFSWRPPTELIVEMSDLLAAVEARP